MNRHQIMKKLCMIAASGTLMASTGVQVFAAKSADEANSTAVKDSLANSDIIDDSKNGSITSFKYDITSAEAAGDYAEGTDKATSERYANAEKKMADDAIKGVQFSYLRVGNVELYCVWNGPESFVELVYEIPASIADILGPTAEDDVINGTAVTDTNKAENIGDDCLDSADTGFYHYTAKRIQDSLTAIITGGNVADKNALESYLHTYNTMDSNTDDALSIEKGSVASDTVGVFDYTDEHGYSHVDGLKLDHYLIVETEVPEQVTETSFFLQERLLSDGNTVKSDSLYFSEAPDEKIIYPLGTYKITEVKTTLHYTLRGYVQYEGRSEQIPLEEGFVIRERAEGSGQTGPYAETDILLGEIQAKVLNLSLNLYDEAYKGFQSVLL